MRSNGADSTSVSLATASPPTPRIGPATATAVLGKVKTTATMKTTANSHAASSAPSASGIVASTTGIAPETGPRQEYPLLYCQAERNGRNEHRNRAGEQRERESGDDGRYERVRHFRGRGQQPSMTNKPICETKQALGERPGRHPVRQRRVAQDQRGDVDRRESARMGHGARRVCQHGQRHDQQRVDADGGGAPDVPQWRPANRPPARWRHRRRVRTRWSARPYRLPPRPPRLR